VRPSLATSVRSAATTPSTRTVIPDASPSYRRQVRARLAASRFRAYPRCIAARRPSCAVAAAPSAALHCSSSPAACWLRRGGWPRRRCTARGRRVPGRWPAAARAGAPAGVASGIQYGVQPGPTNSSCMSITTSAAWSDMSRNSATPLSVGPPRQRHHLVLGELPCHRRAPPGGALQAPTSAMNRQVSERIGLEQLQAFRLPTVRNGQLAAPRTTCGPARHRPWPSVCAVCCRRQQGLGVRDLPVFCRASSWLPAFGRASVGTAGRQLAASAVKGVRRWADGGQRARGVRGRDEEAAVVSCHQRRRLLRGRRPGLRLAGRGRRVQPVVRSAVGRGRHAGVRAGHLPACPRA
jgi:hypothetical protein